MSDPVVIGDDEVVVKKTYLEALEACATAAQEHEDVKAQFWPKEKAMLLALKNLKPLMPT